VGDAKVRGISGGEKKRLALACELIASPSVIFADEPTTGVVLYLIGHLFSFPGLNYHSILLLYNL
jgi:energy-coupling factor transporter ATP-binding protein EcfA2